MGLDMYAWTTSDVITDEVDFDVEPHRCLHEWRKHPDLHGWMEELYYEKGGIKQFNCAKVALTIKDLGRLESDIKSSRLPWTSGFFFGISDGTEIEDDLHFIAKARKAISNGLVVYYDSWW